VHPQFTICLLRAWAYTTPNQLVPAHGRDAVSEVQAGRDTDRCNPLQASIRRAPTGDGRRERIEAANVEEEALAIAIRARGGQAKAKPQR
jgi:hypothetical protein